MITSWCDMANRLKINPRAVARTLLNTLDGTKKLSPSEESRVLFALENCGVEDAVNRMLTDLSRNTINILLIDL